VASELYWRGRCWSAAVVRLRLLPLEHHGHQPRHHRPSGAAQDPPWPNPQGHDAILNRRKIYNWTKPKPRPKPSYSGTSPSPTPAGYSGGEGPGLARPTTKDSQSTVEAWERGGGISSGVVLMVPSLSWLCWFCVYALIQFRI
jgi:hypothetical protein